MGEPIARRSRLLPVGIALVLAAFVLPRPILKVAQGIPEFGLRLAVIILSELFTAGFLVGVGCIAIGAMRNHRWKKEANLKGSAS